MRDRMEAESGGPTGGRGAHDRPTYPLYPLLPTTLEAIADELITLASKPPSAADPAALGDITR